MSQTYLNLLVCYELSGAYNHNQFISSEELTEPRGAPYFNTLLIYYIIHAIIHLHYKDTLTC